MTTEEIIQKAKELGLSREEIEQFIKNEAIAKKYGFSDEFTTLNIEIDKEEQARLNALEAQNTPAQHDCDCECEHECECGCEHCCDCDEDCDCECDCHCHHDHHHN